MKIAICFSGQLRTGTTCAPNILRYIGDLLPDCDFFVHTWDTETQSMYNKSGLPVQTPYKLKDRKIFSDFYACYTPLAMSVEPYYVSKPQGTVWASFRINPKTGRNGFAMFDSIYEANQLKKHHEDLHGFKYDIVVRIRPDLIFRADKSLREDIDLIEHDRMFITANHLGMWGEKHLEDIFWIGNSYVIDKLCGFAEVRENSTFEGHPHDPGYLDWNSHQARWVLQGLGFKYKSHNNNNMRIYYRIDEQNNMDVMNPPFGPEPSFGARPNDFIPGFHQDPYDPSRHLKLTEDAIIRPDILVEENKIVIAKEIESKIIQPPPRTIG